MESMTEYFRDLIRQGPFCVMVCARVVLQRVVVELTFRQSEPEQVVDRRWCYQSGPLKRSGPFNHWL